MEPELTDTLTSLFIPQFEQFGIELSRVKSGFHGTASTERGTGEAWVMPISDTCIAIEHTVAVNRDMTLYEFTPVPYACIVQANVATVDCMPASGIEPHAVSQGRAHGKEVGAAPVYSFVQEHCGEIGSPLEAGSTYYSHTVMFLPGFFADLEKRYPTEFTGLFEAFDGEWDDQSSQVIRAALPQLTGERVLQPGAHLYMRATVDAMVAQLSATHAAALQAAESAQSRTSRALVHDATLLIERAVLAGERPTIEALAQRLFVSRTRLCAVFKQETGESIGAFARRRRIERAMDLLADGQRSAAEVARELGYPQQAAFSQAFKQATGLSPTAWRNRM